MQPPTDANNTEKADFDWMAGPYGQNLEPLAASGSDKFPDEIFVHTKAWIIDDIYFKIGSANVNRRGFTHDSELDIHVIDGALVDGRRRRAWQLRRMLWAEHLQIPSDDLMLNDPSTALKYWKDLYKDSPVKGARVAKYQYEKGDDTRTVKFLTKKIDITSI